MPQAPLRPPPRKQAILQAVYEQNRAAATGRPTAPRRPRPAPASVPKRKGPTTLVAGVAALALLAASWGVVRTARPSATVAPPPAALEPLPPLEALPPTSGADVAELMDLQVRTIVLDPGHGGRDPGAVGPGRLEEKAVTLDVARRLRDRLARHDGLDVLLTRDGDAAMGLKERVAFANDAGADLFVSVHVNALPDTTLAPVETFYFGVEAGATARVLAHAENEGGSFSVSEFNVALRRAGTAVKLQESRGLAGAVQRALLDERAIRRRAASDWGAKPAPFAVLLHTEAPAILAEITALSNPTEEARLRTAAYRDAIAAALETGVLAYLRRPSLPADHRDAHAREDTAHEDAAREARAREADVREEGR